MDNLIDRFTSSVQDQQLNWINEFLDIFLESRPKIKQTLNLYFDKTLANDYDQGIKKFKLAGWCGGDANPTIEIVQVKGEMKFASTYYGVLSPLSKDDCNKQPIKVVIMDFFINPDKYLH